MATAADTQNTDAERLGKKAKEEIAELVRVQKAILKAIVEIESELGEAFMPVGEYHGIKFED